MSEALAAVKRELGPDALIVHTRSFKVGGVLGVGAKEEVEIVASPTAPQPPAPARTRPIQPAAVSERLRAAYAAPSIATAPSEPAPTLPGRHAVPVDSRPRTQARAEITPASRPEAPRAEIIRVRSRQAVAPSEPSAPVAAAATVARLAVDAPEFVPEFAAPALSSTPSPHASTHSAHLQSELDAIKKMVQRLLATGEGTAAAHATPGHHPADPLSGWYLRLLSNAVSRELAERIVSDVRRRIGPGAQSEESIRTTFRECIASHFRIAREPLHLPVGDEPRPRTIALVGATGVGKTTTIAKLAAQAKLNQSARVGVITCDTQRIGAIEQLRTYADIVGAPFRVAGSLSEMRQARHSFGDIDLLLVDTPGLSPRHAEGIESLRQLLAVADPMEVHLALPASGSEASLLRACEAFAPLRAARLLFTKTDEAVTYGVMLSVAAHVRSELSYLTCGPRIPEQIETPDPFRLADLVAAA